MIYLAADHRGFELKEQIKKWLVEWGIEFVDCGNSLVDPGDDYTTFVSQAAAKVAEDPINNRAIVLGLTGQGEGMVANRRRGVRAAVYYGGPVDVLRLSREHNAANVLALGAGFVGDDIKDNIKVWLDTEFSLDERHVRRIGRIDAQY